MRLARLAQRMTLMLLFAASLPAQAAYVAELIIFEHTATSAWLEESWPMQPARLDSSEKDITLSSVMGNGWQQLGEGQWQMRDVLRRLSAAGSYRPLVQAAWQLPTQGRDEANTLTLPEGMSSSGLPVQARIKIYKQKFEHVELEVQVEKRLPPALREAFMKHNRLSADQLGDSWRFRLQESRKIKPGELQYFDHPLFGVILLITQPGG